MHEKGSKAEILAIRTGRHRGSYLPFAATLMVLNPVLIIPVSALVPGQTIPTI